MSVVRSVAQDLAIATRWILAKPARRAAFTLVAVLGLVGVGGIVESARDGLNSSTSTGQTTIGSTIDTTLVSASAARSQPQSNPVAPWIAKQAAVAGSLSRSARVAGTSLESNDERWDLARCPRGWYPGAGSAGGTFRVGIIGPEAAVSAALSYTGTRNSIGGLVDNGPAGIELVELPDLDAVTQALPGLAMILSASPGLDDDVARLAAAACVPHLAMGSPHTSTSSPWSAGIGLDPTTEARMWAQLIADGLAGTETATLVVEDTAVGQEYERELRLVLEERRWGGTLNTAVPGSAPTTDWVLLLVSPESCQKTFDALATTSAAQLWVPSGCHNLAGSPTVLASVRRLAVHNTIRDLLDGGATEQWLTRILRARPASAAQEWDYANGAVLAWTLVEEIGVASRLPFGGVNRTSLLVAIRSMSFTDNPFAGDGSGSLDWSSGQIRYQAAVVCELTGVWRQTDTMVQL